MLAWGGRSFENEAACDWEEELAEHGISVVVATLDKALAVEAKYLTVYDVAVAIAACEIKARLMGGDFLLCPNSVKVIGWVEACNQMFPPDTEEKAIDVIDHILTRPTESLALWQTDYYKTCWYENVWNIRFQIYSIMPEP